MRRSKRKECVLSYTACPSLWKYIPWFFLQHILWSLSNIGWILLHTCVATNVVSERSQTRSRLPSGVTILLFSAARLNTSAHRYHFGWFDRLRCVFSEPFCGLVALVNIPLLQFRPTMEFRSHMHGDSLPLMTLLCISDEPTRHALRDKISYFTNSFSEISPERIGAPFRVGSTGCVAFSRGSFCGSLLQFRSTMQSLSFGDSLPWMTVSCISNGPRKLATLRTRFPRFSELRHEALNQQWNQRPRLPKLQLRIDKVFWEIKTVGHANNRNLKIQGMLIADIYCQRGRTFAEFEFRKVVFSDFLHNTSLSNFAHISGSTSLRPRLNKCVAKFSFVKSCWSGPAIWCSRYWRGASRNFGMYSQVLEPQKDRVLASGA